MNMTSEKNRTYHKNTDANNSNINNSPKSKGNTKRQQLVGCVKRIQKVHFFGCQHGLTLQAPNI